MDHQKSFEILQSVSRSYCPRHQVDLRSSDDQFKSDAFIEKLSEAIKDELSVAVTLAEMKSAGSLSTLSTLVESRLMPNDSGKTLVDIYMEVERLAREEYHPRITYEWCAKWNEFLRVGNFLTRPESLDSVEIVIRMEEEYGIRIADQDAEEMETIGQTIRYLWAKTGGDLELQLSRSNI